VRKIPDVTIVIADQATLVITGGMFDSGGTDRLSIFASGSFEAPPTIELHGLADAFMTAALRNDPTLRPEPGGMVEVLSRGEILSGMFADGSPFRISLRTSTIGSSDGVVRLRLVAIPEPATASLLIGMSAVLLTRRQLFDI